MKKFSSVLCVLLALALVLSCVGCSSMPEPSDETSTLLVGMTTFQYVNRDKDVSPDAKDRHVAYNGIKVRIREQATGKILTLVSGIGGIIARAGVNPGAYELLDISYKQEYGNRWTKFTWDFQKFGGKALFEVADDGVTNMGVLRLEYDYDKASMIIYHGIFYDPVVDAFEERFPESAWIDESWKNVYYSRRK